jgi:hypothetical protein
MGRRAHTAAARECAMTQPRKPVREADVQELLSDEIGRLVMRADRVERHDVEALLHRVKTPRRECAPTWKKELVP